MKTLGIILIMCGFSGMGIYLTALINKRLDQTETMLIFFKYIKNQIDFFNAPLPSVYQSFETDNKAFFEFVDLLKTKDWTSAIEESDKLLYDKKTKDIIIKFGAELGTTDRIGQLAHCNYYIELLEKEYTEAKINSKNQIKVTLALCVYAGLMLLILFL